MKKLIESFKIDSSFGYKGLRFNKGCTVCLYENCTFLVVYHNGYQEDISFLCMPIKSGVRYIFWNNEAPIDFKNTFERIKHVNKLNQPFLLVY